MWSKRTKNCTELKMHKFTKLRKIGLGITDSFVSENLYVWAGGYVKTALLEVISVQLQLYALQHFCI